MANTVDRETFGYCRETCPEVSGAISDAASDIRYLFGAAGEAMHLDIDKIMDGLFETVKQVGTEKLREALRSCVSDKQDIEGDLADARHHVESLEGEVADLQSQVRQLEKELNECHT